MGDDHTITAGHSAVTESELEQLYRDEALGMTRLAFLMVGRRDIAEEVVHDAFAAIRPKLTSGAVTNPGGYLRMTVVNECRMWLRRAEIERRNAPEPPPPAGADDDEIALHIALRTLSARQRAAVVLRYFADQTDDEIATAIDCRPSTVRSLLRRGVAALREELT